MLQSLLSRPQRLITLLVVFLVILLFSTYASLSTSSTEALRSHLKNLPTLFNNQTCPATKLVTADGAEPNKFYSNLKTVEDLRKFSTRASDGNLYPPEFRPSDVNKAPRANAAFIVLARNEDLAELRGSMRDGVSVRVRTNTSGGPFQP